MKNKKIVVVGSCMMDFVSYAPRLPLKGETIHGTKFVTTFGGKGANQCVAAAKLGGDTLLVARVGDDIWADKYIQNLINLNVDVKYVQRTVDCSSGIAQINVSASGDNQIVIIAGANAHLSEEDINQATKEVEAAAVLVCQLETPWKVALKALALCKGVTILNGAPAIEDYDKRLLCLPTIFCVNESEASIFTGLSINNLEEAFVAANKLLELGCNSIIITLGANGAVYVSKEISTPLHIKSPKVECVDTTGAGDAFIGALAYLIANRQDLSMEEQILKACSVASDSVTRLGTQISFPGPEILMKVLPPVSKSCTEASALSCADSTSR